MSTLVTGAGGGIGRAIAADRSILALSRQDRGGPWWEPMEGRVHLPEDEPVEAVVHLAGEPIAGQRWTEESKARMRDSRTVGTRTLVDWMASRARRPRVLVSASAVGIYGSRGDEELDEDAGVGEGFLAELVRDWEAEALRAEELGVRVVCLRIGIVMDPASGALSEMLTPARFGLGGPLGSGQQWMAWVHVEDVVRGFLWALDTPSARGSYNLTAPGVLRQVEVARTLGGVLNRPAFLPAPMFALRLAFGEFADEALVASQRARPRRLLEEGFAFEHPELEPALRNLLAP